MPNAPKGDLLPGTLEMLILVTLRREPLHGYAIAQRIQQDSGELLYAEEGSLYPALQRLLIEGWVSAEWGVSARNRRVRIYTLTAAGRKQLGREMKRVGRLIDGLTRMMRPSEAQRPAAAAPIEEGTQRTEPPQVSPFCASPLKA